MATTSYDSDKAVPPLPRLLAMASTRTLTTLARALAPTRTLEREPGWFFDVSENDTSGAVALRRHIWRTLRSRGSDTSAVVPWYDGLHLKLYLGTDLSKCIFVGGAFEPNELAFMREYLSEGMVVADVGANEGVYTVYGASRVGPTGWVIAFEPSSRELGRLRDNVELNGLANVEIIAAAVGDVDGVADLAIAEAAHAGQNTVGERVANPKVTTLRHETVSVRTLDSVVSERGLERLDFMKIDAEGSERRVLRGARETLARLRPVLQLELEATALESQGADVGSVSSELSELDYTIWIFDAATGLLRRHSTELLSGNIIAAPTDWRPPSPHGS